MSEAPDLSCICHGSIWLIYANTETGQAWVAEHIDEEATRWHSGAVVVEPRYVAAIAEGAMADGLTVARS
jgi:hypothetical protein